MAQIRAVAVLPTLFTLSNLICGFFSIVVAARIDAPDATLIDPRDPTNIMISGWLIFLAMVFDALDGHVARLARTTSDFGGQLDSLCDVVTFGVAPAFLLVKMCPAFAYIHREAIWIVAAAFAACAAMRLARFNAENTVDDDHLHFSGLPSPAAAASVAGFAIFFYTLRKDLNAPPYADQVDYFLQMLLPFYAAALGLLMVSRIPYPHVVNQIFKGERSLGHIVSVLFALVAIVAVRGYAVPLVCLAFVLNGPWRYFWQEVVERRPHEEPLF